MASPMLLWVDAAWLLVLAFLYLVVYREYSLLRARIMLDERTVSDGPEIGSLVPTPVALIQHGGRFIAHIQGTTMISDRDELRDWWSTSGQLIAEEVS